MSIQRFPEGRRGRSAAVAHNGMVYAVAVDPADAEGLAAQTRNALAELDRVLALADADKTGLLQATVYLTEMSEKEVMDAIWCDWIGPEANWPQRACVGAKLAGKNLIEIVVTAAAKHQ